MKPSYIIAISAVSGGGKTAVSRELKSNLLESQLFCFDDYEDSNIYPDDFYLWFKRGGDNTEFDFPLLYRDVMKEIENGTSIIILDYPFGREHPKFSTVIDLHIFIDTPLDLALSRRLQRDKSDLKTLRFYENQARPMLIDFQNKHRKICDLLLDGSLPIQENITKILSVINSN